RVLASWAGSTGDAFPATAHGWLSAVTRAAVRSFHGMELVPRHQHSKSIHQREEETRYPADGNLYAFEPLPEPAIFACARYMRQLSRAPGHSMASEKRLRTSSERKWRNPNWRREPLT